MTAADPLNPGFDALFAGMFAELFGIGTYPEPPDITVLRLLGLDDRPATQDGVKAAFRARLRQVHPDIAAYENTHLAAAAGAVAVQRPEVRELMWARDVLLRKVPAAVTDNKGGVSAPINRNACKACGRTITGLFGKPEPLPATTMHRWRGYCATCANDAERARQRDLQRDLRREARADRECLTCDRVFTPARADGLYCSPACRQKAYRARGASAAARESA